MKRAVVLLSGGLDSATVLAQARAEGWSCHCLTVDYGQRHRAEIEAARRLAARLGATEHRVVALDLGWIGASALTDFSIPVPAAGASGVIPLTYVPARNTILLALGLAWAEAIGAGRVGIGANAVDGPGYPDCRPEYLAAFARLAALGTRAGSEGAAIEIWAPLVALPKSEILRRAVALGLDPAETVSCYRADPEGRACGECDACVVRRNGFRAAGLPDTTRYAASLDILRATGR